MTRFMSTGANGRMLRVRVNSWMRRTVWAPSCAACRMRVRLWATSGDCWRASRSSLRSITIASKLLKSWATPAAISPRARSRSTWTS